MASSVHRERLLASTGYRVAVPQALPRTAVRTMRYYIVSCAGDGDVRTRSVRVVMDLLVRMKARSGRMPPVTIIDLPDEMEGASRGDRA